MQPHCALILVTITAYLQALMEVYVKTVTGLGPKEEYQVCFVGFLGCYVFDLYYVFDALFWFQLVI